MEIDGDSGTEMETAGVFNGIPVHCARDSADKAAAATAMKYPRTLCMDAYFMG
jgi:hypothetical protein